MKLSATESHSINMIFTSIGARMSSIQEKRKCREDKEPIQVRQKAGV